MSHNVTNKNAKGRCIKENHTNMLPSDNMEGATADHARNMPSIKGYLNLETKFRIMPETCHL